MMAAEASLCPVELMFLFFCLLGIRSWDTNLIDCNLDQELKLFVSRHSARFSADVRGKVKVQDNVTDESPAVQRLYIF